MSERRQIVWFSCGAASAVTAMLSPDALPVYCETGSEHPDNARFFADCERWFGRKIIRLCNDKYRDTWHVWKDRRYMAGINGAPCTVALKVEPRLAFQRPTDIHTFGYSADLADMTRAVRLRETYPELSILTPLIDRGLSKVACIAMIERAGIKPPIMYELGYQNNNCIPCVKATSPAYWALIRKTHPAEFSRAAKLSRELGARLCRLNGERAFIDEIPPDHSTCDPIQPACDFLCHIAEQDYAPRALAGPPKRGEGREGK